MSTRSNIGVEDAATGAVTFIYCHFDGYPEHHAPILTKCYATEELARALVAPGDMSSLDVSVGEKHDFDGRRERGWCRYYGRDRGETNIAARTAPTREAFLRTVMEETGIAYLFRDGAWWYSDRNQDWTLAAGLVAEEEGAEGGAS